MSTQLGVDAPLTREEFFAQLLETQPLVPDSVTDAIMRQSGLNVAPDDLLTKRLISLYAQHIVSDIIASGDESLFWQKLEAGGPTPGDMAAEGVTQASLVAAAMKAMDQEPHNAYTLASAAAQAGFTGTLSGEASASTSRKK